MATYSSQAIPGVRESTREGSGGEDDNEEILDPRVKEELDRLNSSTVEINRLEQDLEELQAAFRQTLTESAYVLKSQASFLGKCINHARPYYDAVRKAKQSQIETQRAALKYERACSSHQAAKKMLAIAEQKLVSTSKEHKVLDPAWQEMLNQAVLKVMEADKERALSEREHLHTARAFSEAGNKVSELRTKLKSAINKSRPYFDLKTKYDQILETHKRQVEATQEGLQESKRKYSSALKNLEEISEEIHEMRRSRDSLNTILLEREEGVGAESPEGDLSHDTQSSASEIWVGAGPVKAAYGFTIGVVSASAEVKGLAEEQTDDLPVGERDEDPEGCNFLDEHQRDFACEDEELRVDKDSVSEGHLQQEKLGTAGDEMCENTIKGRDVSCGSETRSDVVFPERASGSDYKDVKGEEVTEDDLTGSQFTGTEEEVTRVPLGDAIETSNGAEHSLGEGRLSSAVDSCADHSGENDIQDSVAVEAPLSDPQPCNRITEDESIRNQGSADSVTPCKVGQACEGGEISEAIPLEASEETVPEQSIRRDESDVRNDVGQRSVDREISEETIDDAGGLEPTGSEQNVGIGETGTGSKVQSDSDQGQAKNTVKEGETVSQERATKNVSAESTEKEESETERDIQDICSQSPVDLEAVDEAGCLPQTDETSP
ncbi:uro-adherence factor A-like [Montipora foliosa]|uniref:uro-adherence factor A-like n=1 Tax=Montipora foliosa TaxID=591990 RepID=UPI0035F1052A